VENGIRQHIKLEQFRDMLRSFALLEIPTRVDGFEHLFVEIVTIDPVVVLSAADVLDFFDYTLKADESWRRDSIPR
jgi:hypothetical protein